MDAGSTYMAEVEKWVCEWAAGVTADSGFLRDELAQVYQVPLERVEVIGCGVNPESLQPGGDVRLFRRLFGEEWDLLVGFVGRLAFAKGPQVLLEAARGLFFRPARASVPGRRLVEHPREPQSLRAV